MWFPLQITEWCPDTSVSLSLFLFAIDGSKSYMGVKSLRLMIVVNTVTFDTPCKLLDTVQGPVFTTFSEGIKGAAYLK